MNEEDEDQLLTVPVLVTAFRLFSLLQVEAGWGGLGVEAYDRGKLQDADLCMQGWCRHRLCNRLRMCMIGIFIACSNCGLVIGRLLYFIIRSLLYCAVCTI